MSTETLPVPVLDDTTDDDLNHAVCCDDDTAMCGLYVPTEQYRWLGDDEETTCPLCAWVEDEGLPCTIPGCPGGAS